MRSLTVALCLALTLPASAADTPLRRFAVVAGASLGGPGRTPLRYATTDARDVSRVFWQLGGVARGDLVLLEEPDADRLRAALSNVAAEVERTRAAGRRAEIFLYYSGHSDEEGLLLGSSRLSYAELRSALDRVPANVRVAILDSCASGAFTRAKGGVHGPPFLLDDSNKVQGHAFLTSSAATEAAQESDRLRASFFTHALLTGLRGAADASGDGVVTLNEAYQFAFRETLAGTESTVGGPQHATYDIGLVGTGDVVMTDLHSGDALLVMPESLEGRVFIRNGAGQLVAELRKAKGARVELALESGRYEVKVSRERVLAGTVELGPSARVVLDESQLTPSRREATVSRGDGEPIQDPIAEAPAPITEPRVGSPTSVPSAPQKARGVTSFFAGGGPAFFFGWQPSVGVSVDLALSTWLDDVFGVEIASGYQSINLAKRANAAWQASGFPEVHDELRMVPTTLTLKFAFPRYRVRPYLLAGTGLYFVHVDRFPVDANGNIGSNESRLSDNATTLAFHVGVGATMPLGSRSFATAEARYGWDNDARMFDDRYVIRVLRVAAGVGYSF